MTLLHSLCLPFSWVLGMIVGCLFGAKLPDPVISLMRTSFSERVSIVWLFVAILLPFFLSVTTIRFSLQRLLFLLSFVKAYCFAFCLYCINRAFGSAGWIMSFFCFFSDACSNAILLWFSLTHSEWKPERCMHDFAICVTALIALCCLDYFIVSPFMVMLLNY